MKKCERTAPGVDLKGMKVLVADDEYINNELASEILTERGLVVTLAANGEEAVAEFKRYNFDLVLMDMVMPVMDGYEAVREIRKYEMQGNGGHTAIIAMTGYSGEEVQQECLESGFDGYIAKPIIWKVMFNEIARVLSERAAPPEEKNTGGESAGLDYDKFVAEMCNGNETLAIKLVNRFIIERCPELFKAVKGAVDEKDVKMLREICHSLTGVSASMCASEIAVGARELRQLAIDGDWESMPALLDQLRDAHYRIMTWWEKVLLVSAP
jgi:CheY-like chemotaxis protein/HPt (histidine-containing phosphotransfer) domain-containing protein